MASSNWGYSQRIMPYIMNIWLYLELDGAIQMQARSQGGGRAYPTHISGPT